MIQWGRASQFPLFDILRMVALHPQGASVLAQYPLRASWQPSVLAVLGMYSISMRSPNPELISPIQFLS